MHNRVQWDFEANWQDSRVAQSSLWDFTVKENVSEKHSRDQIKTNLLTKWQEKK